MRMTTWAIILLMLSCKQKDQKLVATTATTDTIASIASPVHQDTVSMTDTTAEPAKVPVNRLIVPGVSIGMIALDEPGEDVQKKLGTADDGDAAMGKSMGIWYSKSKAADGTRYSTTIYFVANYGGKDERSRAKQMRITSPFFMTAEKISCGSSLAAIQQFFPLVKKAARYPSPVNKKMVYVYDDEKGGIAFEVNDKNQCVGIAIHLPGTQAFATYLEFFSGFERL
ncbi:MAG: hypothetical protein JWQ27_1639 [Ferruginibacter sp.]|nr:hypothetical protein [Ferruginibacter sp.]